MADSPRGTVEVRVFPRARKSGIRGLRDGRILFGVLAPPEDGRANEELIKALAKLLGVPKSAISVVSGTRSREKSLSVEGLSCQEIMSRLEKLIPAEEGAE